MKLTTENMEALHDCPACQEPIAISLTVCWYCFKYRENPYKYSELSLEDWLKEIKS